MFWVNPLSIHVTNTLNTVIFCLIFFCVYLFQDTDSPQRFQHDVLLSTKGIIYNVSCLYSNSSPQEFFFKFRFSLYSKKMLWGQGWSLWKNMLVCSKNGKPSFKLSSTTFIIREKVCFTKFRPAYNLTVISIKRQFDIFILLWTRTSLFLTQYVRSFREESVEDRFLYPPWKFSVP